MTKRKVNGIFFDLGWTLEYPASGDWVLTNRFFDFVNKESFFRIDEEVRKQAVDTAFRPLLEHHHMTSCEEENRRFTGFYETLNHELNLQLSAKAVHEIAYDHTYNFSNYVLFDSTAEVLKTLKAHGYRVGVISDTWPSTVPQQKEAGLYDYYDFLTLSFELGVLKPHPLMYEDALKHMNLPPEETLYIDDLTMSLDAAGKIGIPGVCSIAPHPDTPVSSYPCITQPGELLDLIRVRNGGSL